MRPAHAMLCAAVAIAHPALAQTDTTFMYQGTLEASGQSADGPHDMSFTLWDALAAGNEVGPTVVLPGVQVAEGLFTVELDFGADSFNNASRWLELEIAGATLSPRQPVTRAPYALQTRGLFVDENENVGIGTTTPQHLLEVISDTGFHAISGYTTETTSASAGVFGQTDSVNGHGLFGYAISNTGFNHGVYGRTNSDNGRGVFGRAAGGSGATYGVYGQSQSDNGTGVFGWASSNSGTTNGVWGVCESPNGFAGRFHGRGFFSGFVGFGQQAPAYPVHALRSNGTAICGEGLWGVQGTTIQPDGRGVFGYDATLDGVGTGVYGLTAGVNGRGVYGLATNSFGSNYGVYGESASTTGRGVYGFASDLVGVNHGVHGESDSMFGRGVVGHATSVTGTTQGVRGEVESATGTGVVGLNNAATGDANGVYGQSDSVSGTGVAGRVAGTNATGVFGFASAAVGTTFGVYGKCSSDDGYAFFADSAGGTDYGSISSRRWKNNVVAIDDPLGKLAQIRGVYYDWDEAHGGTHDIGMIAEEVGAVMPEIVQYEDNGVDAIGMDYSRATPLLVEAVKALQEQHEAEVGELRRRIASLESRLESIPQPTQKDQE